LNSAETSFYLARIKNHTLDAPDTMVNLVQDMLLRNKVSKDQIRFDQVREMLAHCGLSANYFAFIYKQETETTTDFLS
jgi:hypothetical protein